MILSCVDSDQSIRALLERYPAAKDIEIAGGSLEEAFLELTGEPDADESSWGRDERDRLHPL